MKGGWKESYAAPSGNNQSHHAITYFAIGYLGAVTATSDSAAGLVAAVVLMEANESFVRGRNGGRIDWGDVRLGIEAAFLGGAVKVDGHSVTHARLKGLLCDQ